VPFSGHKGRIGHPDLTQKIGQTPGTMHGRRGSAPLCKTARPGSPTTSCRSATAPNNACTASTRTCAPATSTAT
jgi:hypothetical protein